MSWHFLFANGIVADWILLTAFHSLWLSVAGFLIISLRRFKAPAVRSTWCTFILILLLILPVITWLVPRPAIAIRPGQVASVRASSAILEAQAPLINNLLDISTPASQAVTNQWKIRVNQFGVLWLAVTLGFAGRLLYGLAFLRGYCDCLREVADRRLTVILQEIDKSFDFRLRPRFFVSLTLPSPVSMGIPRPVVILPAALYQSVDDGELRAILLHELAHIHHSDHALGLLQQIVKALYWWNPCVYRVCSTLSAAREEVSDNYAISALGSATDYASLLVRLVSNAALIDRVPCVAGMATPYQSLETRIWNIVSRHRDLRVKPGKGMVSAIAATAVLLCALVGIGSQVKVFGAGQVSISGDVKATGADVKSSTYEAITPVQRGGTSPATAPEESTPLRQSTPIRTGQRIDTAITSTPDQATAVWSHISRSGASSASFPTLRNEAADTPQATPLRLFGSDLPVVRSRVELKYPSEAVRAKISGIVQVAVVVNEKGEVYEAKIMMGHPWFQRPALNAALQWKFEPKLVDGTPRAFSTAVEFRF